MLALHSARAQGVKLAKAALSSGVTRRPGPPSPTWNSWSSSPKLAGFTGTSRGGGDGLLNMNMINCSGGRTPWS